MRIDELIAAGEGPVFSFEFFPPKTDEGEQNLFRTLQELRTLEPAFVSVTWGAGGSTREKTIGIVSRIRADHDLEAMAHFTCVGATRDDLHAALRQMREAGIDNVLALRGDPPQGRDRVRGHRGRPRLLDRARRARLRRATTSASSGPATPRSIPRRPTWPPTSST